jgi:hypothetical protein
MTYHRTWQYAMATFMPPSTGRAFMACQDPHCAQSGVLDLTAQIVLANAMSVVGPKAALPERLLSPPLLWAEQTSGPARFGALMIARP